MGSDYWTRSRLAAHRGAPLRPIGDGRRVSVERDGYCRACSFRSAMPGIAGGDGRLFRPAVVLRQSGLQTGIQGQHAARS